MSTVGIRPLAAQNNQQVSKVEQSPTPAASSPAAKASAASAGTSVYAYNPVSGSPLSDSDLAAALKEVGTGINFTAEDFANGQNYLTKIVDGIQATATYDPITHTINAYGTDDKGDVFIAEASGDIGAGVHFGMTTEGQMLARAVGGGGEDSQAFVVGHAADGATVQLQGQGHTDSGMTGGDSPLNTLTTLTGVVGDKRSLGTGSASANDPADTTSPAATPTTSAVAATPTTPSTTSISPAAASDTPASGSIASALRGG